MLKKYLISFKADLNVCNDRNPFFCRENVLNEI